MKQHFNLEAQFVEVVDLRCALGEVSGEQDDGEVHLATGNQDRGEQRGQCFHLRFAHNPHFRQ